MSIVQQLIQHSQPYWQNYVEHAFVRQLADGSLDKASFQHYLKQDYLYLFHYTRALSLAIYKAENFAQMRDVQESIAVILKETELHVAFCHQWGISERELLQLEESPACVAYTRYVLDCGMTGGLAELYAAIAPCVFGYAEIGRNIVQRGLSPAGNPYQDWIDMYASADFQQAAIQLSEFFAQLCEALSPTQMEKIQQIFNTATRMEAAFWQMGLDLS